MKRVLLALCVALVGSLSLSMGTHHAAAHGIISAAAEPGDFQLSAEVLGPNEIACFDGNASQCTTGSYDNHIFVNGPATRVGTPTFVNFVCDAVSVHGGYLHQDITELYGSFGPNVYESLTYLRGIGIVLKPGPTVTGGSAGFIAVQAGGSGTGSSGTATGIFTTGPRFSTNSDSGPITSGTIHITITGPIVHSKRPVTSTRSTDWVTEPTTTGTMTCTITSSPNPSNGYAN